MPPLANAKQIIANAEANEGVLVKEDLSISYTPPPGMGIETANANKKGCWRRPGRTRRRSRQVVGRPRRRCSPNPRRGICSRQRSNAGPQQTPHPTRRPAHSRCPKIQLRFRRPIRGWQPSRLGPRMTSSKLQSCDHNASPPPLNDASAINIYNQNADALNAKKAASRHGSRQKTVPSQRRKGTSVSEWTHPDPRNPGRDRQDRSPAIRHHHPPRAGARML